MLFNGLTSAIRASLVEGQPAEQLLLGIRITIATLQSFLGVNTTTAHWLLGGLHLGGFPDRKHDAIFVFLLVC